MRGQQIPIEMGDKEAEGIYSNMVRIGHTPNEILLDFARVMPGLNKAKVLVRIIMTPMHAKTLKMALTDNIERYEKQFGEIKVVGNPQQPSKNIGFGSGDNDPKKDK